MTQTIKKINKLKDQHEAGVIHLKSGVIFDLQNPTICDIHMDDIAWSLSRQIRYNGHIPYAYTVARHSILMSYVVPEEFAMEALLHDSGEAFISDVVYPLKRLLPQIDEIEDTITALVMKKFNLDWKGGDVYKKSNPIAIADYEAYQWECHIFGRPDGVHHLDYNRAQEKAFEINNLLPLEVDSMSSDYTAFIHRFWQLFEPMFARRI